MRAYPTDSLENTLRNVFDFDMYKPEAMDFLVSVLEHHGFVQLPLSCYGLIETFCGQAEGKPPGP